MTFPDCTTRTLEAIRKKKLQHWNENKEDSRAWLSLNMMTEAARRLHRVPPRREAARGGLRGAAPAAGRGRDLGRRDVQGDRASGRGAGGEEVSLKVSLEEGGALLHLTLDAGKGNIVTGAVMSALDRAARGGEGSSPKVRCVLLDAAGPDFSFGASVEEHRPAQAKAMIETFSKLIRAMIELPVPLLVAVNGRCLGGAMEVALAGSRIFASQTAMLGQPEIKLAVFAPPASVLLPLRVGQAKAEDLLLSGRTVGAARGARAWGWSTSCARPGSGPLDPGARVRDRPVLGRLGLVVALRDPRRAGRAREVGAAAARRSRAAVPLGADGHPRCRRGNRGLHREASAEIPGR